MRSHQRGIRRKNCDVKPISSLHPCVRITTVMLISVAFKVYDMDRDGFISNGELFIVLKMMVGSNLKDQQLQQVVCF